MENQNNLKSQFKGRMALPTHETKVSVFNDMYGEITKIKEKIDNGADPAFAFFCFALEGENNITSMGFVSPYTFPKLMKSVDELKANIDKEYSCLPDDKSGKLQGIFNLLKQYLDNKQNN